MKVLPLFAIAAFSITAGAQTASGNGSTNVTAPRTDASQNMAAAASRNGVSEAGTAAAQSRHAAGAATEAGSVSRSATAARGNLSQASSATAQAGHFAGSGSQATSLSAELTRSIDSKHAKVGDPVQAKTTRRAVLADGTKLPKGTRLIGHVTKVSRESRSIKTAQLAFGFDHAVLRNGREVPIHAALRSLSAPAPIGGADGAFAGDAGMNSGMMNAGGAGVVRGGGGLLGGAGRGVAGGSSALAGGALGAGGNVAGGAANSLRTATAGANAAAAGEAGAATRAGGRNLGGALDAGAGTSAQGQMIPVGNLRGVSFSSASDPGSSAMLQANGHNIDLSSGSQMTLAVSAAR